MIKKLYQNYANYYESFARDRDFLGEVVCLTDIHSQSKELQLLELFAGPAYHSIVAEKLGFSNVIAIDNSDQMKSIAKANGFVNGNNYLVDTIPEVFKTLENNQSFDIIICMRFSIGYLSLEKLYKFFESINLLLRKDGYLIIEVHDISLITSNMKDSNIRARKSILPSGEKMNCIWPSGNIKWDKFSYKVQMDVDIDVTDIKGEVKNLSFCSNEYLYSAEIIMFLAKLNNLNSIIINDINKSIKKCFSDSIIIKIQKS